MEDRAPYLAAAPQGPRNLAAPLAAWLRTQGFTALEQAHPTLTTVQAHWLDAQQARFELTYTWLAGPVASATCQLAVRYPGCPQPETLVAAQHVRRLKDARQLLLSSVRYRNARLLASGPVATS